MKLLIPVTAIIAAAAAGSVYSSQPAESYAQSAELYQSQLEYQQQGLYSDQSQTLGEHGTRQGRPGEKNARILSFVSEKDGHGYQYAYETENGIKAQESGQTHNGGTVAQGAYSYTGDDGHVYTVTYTADEHGFHAQGGHLPTPPPMPEEIAKSLEQNAKDEAAGIYDDGKYVEIHEEHSQPAQQLHQASQGFQPLHHEQASQGHQLQQIHQASQGFQPLHHEQASQGHQLQQIHQASQGFQPLHHEQASQGHQLQQIHQASQGFQPLHHEQASQGHQLQQLHQASQGYQVQQPQQSHYEAPAFHHDAYSAHLTPPTEGFHKH